MQARPAQDLQICWAIRSISDDTEDSLMHCDLACQDRGVANVKSHTGEIQPAVDPKAHTPEV